ncbi:FAD-dependent oxidoreductase [Paenibacillus sp. CCS19]|uniref:NAD(P)/FAD-dependent oxidoreductase n=1 Tax=Paenibacillus sp. CCS19 TaxID=3158387 RepID=UPI00256ADE0C|nr:NAD(P)/FAD-dependent oxidoreductase [Paenibacillus cellulosilyticus]GMK39720.1 FAD-dependent oxidoreductase [Paenibacillus cellulosilyticus]
MNHHYDVIIVGARVAGSTLAYELSRAGYEVLLVDKGEFPSDILSTHNFFNNSLAILREMGVLDRLLQTRTPLYKRAVVQFEDAVIDGDFPEVNGESDCLCIRRLHLDQILFEHATSQPGVTSLEGFRVTDVIREGNTVTGITGVHRSGETQQFTAKLVVGADGRNSTLRKRVNSAQIMAVPTDYASYVGYFSGYEQDGDIHVELYRINDNMVIVFPTSDQLYVVGVMFPLDDEAWSERFAQSPETAMRDLIDSGFGDSPLPARVQKSTLVGKVRGLRGYDNDWHQGMGEGWALVGDALSFKDPAVGQGMHDALVSARTLTNVLSQHANWETEWEQMAQSYQSLAEAKMMSRYHMACQITKNVPFTPEQTMVNRLVAAHPEATSAFLGMYNHALEPQQFGEVIGRLLQGS